MLKIRSRMIPYVLATAIAAGGAATSLKAQNDQFIKQEEKIEQPKSTESATENRNRKWINFWEILSLVGIAGIFKLADYIDKKEQQKEEAKSEADTINQTEQ